MHEYRFQAVPDGTPMPVMLAGTYGSTRPGNPYVRRRWSTVALLATSAMTVWDLVIGVVLGGIRLSPDIVELLPGRSVILSALLLTAGIATPSTIAAYLTLASSARADRAIGATAVGATGTIALFVLPTTPDLLAIAAIPLAALAFGSWLPSLGKPADSM